MRKSFHFASGAAYDDFAASDFCFRIYLLRLLFKKKETCIHRTFPRTLFYLFSKELLFFLSGIPVHVCMLYARIAFAYSSEGQ